MVVAKVLDYTPAAMRRSLDQPPAEGELAATACEDMCDGILATDFALTFSGAPYEARQFVLSIVGLLGATEAALECFDDELAGHFNCSVRTLRRWRSEHIAWSKRKKFSLLVIVLGEYDAEHKRYKKSAYYLNEGVADYVNAVVAGARASELYARDRRKAIELAAGEHYHLIPDAPQRQRKKKPYRARGTKVEHPFVVALRNVERGEHQLEELSDESRAVYLQTGQGEELRETLLKLRAKVSKILWDFPQPAEGEEL